MRQRPTYSNLNSRDSSQKTSNKRRDRRNQSEDKADQRYERRYQNEEKSDLRDEGQQNFKDLIKRIYNKDRQIKVLMVAEKPMVAKSIANALSYEGNYKSYKGICKYTQVHEFDKEIFPSNSGIKHSAQIRVTSVLGHIYGNNFPRKQSDWNNVNPRDLFDADTVIVDGNQETNKIIRNLQKEAQDCNVVVLWLDNDREGENICFEVLDVIKNHFKRQPVLKSSGDQIQNVFRAKISSTTYEDIEKAFENLCFPPDQNKSRSVDARRTIDLKIGCAFTRLQTNYLRKRFPQKFQNMIVSFGPCQTPALNFVVQQHFKVIDFKPQEFWVLVPKIRLGGITKTLDIIEKRYFDKNEASEERIKLEKSVQIYVKDKTTKNFSKRKPEGLDTITQLKQASAHQGFSPNVALATAQKLYGLGFISYPRTETTAYSDHFDYDGILTSMKKYGDDYLYHSAEKLRSDRRDPRDGVDAEDHEPITPTVKIPSTDRLNSQDKKQYEFICRYFFATISDDAKTEVTEYVFEIGNQQFTAQGLKVKSKGFIEFLYETNIEEITLPELDKGQRVSLERIYLESKFTIPPEHLTESDLLDQMEKNSIGTDASMAKHIQNLSNREYVTIDAVHRSMKPTNIGVSLIKGYDELDPELISADLRSGIENKVNQIATGKEDYETVLKDSLDKFKHKFEYFEDNINKLENQFQKLIDPFKTAFADGKPFSECGKCGNEMMLLGEFNQLHCRKCELTLSLPKEAEFTLPKDRVYCPVDGFEVIYYYTVKNGKESKLTLCPYCYDKPPQEPSDQGNGNKLPCSDCPDKECGFSAYNTSVQKCSKCKKGNMILNQMFDDQVILSCNNFNCKNIIYYDEKALSSKVLGKRCKKCKANYVELELLNGKFVERCLFCR